MIFGISGNTTKGMVRGVIPELLNWLEERKISYILDKELLRFLSLSQIHQSTNLENLGEESDVVLTFGGDGTLLATARAVGASGVPILGVNLGGLGFLTEVAFEELYSTLENILHNDFTMLDRIVLEATIQFEGQKKKHFALNDVVIDRDGFSRMFRVDVFINEEFVNTYLGDGIIIATPTGSTAYSLSSGGPIVVPTLDCMIITPICQHSLSVRPLVIPDTSCIRVVPHLEGRIVTVSVDGQINQQFVKTCDIEIVIRRAEYNIRWIQNRRRTFYDLLRTKLNWGSDQRMF
ncbi:MAG: NAD(+)/NADH kinase [Candidatus Zhuqueibacterota bacterium]